MPGFGIDGDCVSGALGYDVVEAAMDGCCGADGPGGYTNEAPGDDGGGYDAPAPKFLIGGVEYPPELKCGGFDGPEG